MKVAFVGAGKYARTHMDRFAAIEDVELAGVTSRTLATAEEAAAPHGMRAYETAEEMIDAAEPDALVICVIPAAHGAPERLAVERGIPFLVEKPVGLDLEAAQHIAREVQAKGLVTAVGYQWRYLDLVERARELIDKSPVLLAQGYWLSRKPGAAWWHDPSLSGGQIVEQATHMADLLRVFLGDPEQVYGVFSAPGTDSRVPAASAATLRFPGGVPGTLICACALPVRYRNGFVVHTEQQVVELVSTASGMENVRMTVRTADGDETAAPAMDPVLAQDRAFVAAVRASDPQGVRCDYADAVRTLRVSLAAAQSAQSGEAVRF